MFCDITDNQLSALLVKINAKENTRSISLIGCRDITGRGLVPLSGSRVLENIDLRVRGSLPLTGDLGKKDGPMGIDEVFVTRILYSMLPSDEYHPFALRRVVFRHGFFLRPILFGFFQYFDCWKKIQETRSTSCCKCNRLFADVCNRRCCHCTEFPCFDDKCSNEMVSCSLCLDTCCSMKKDEYILCSICDEYYCEPCAMPLVCTDCKVKKCQWCSNIVKCVGCNKIKALHNMGLSAAIAVTIFFALIVRTTSFRFVLCAMSIFALGHAMRVPTKMMIICHMWGTHHHEGPTNREILLRKMIKKTINAKNCLNTQLHSVLNFLEWAVKILFLYY